MWTFVPLTDFFWNFHGNLELVKVKNVHLEKTVLPGSANYFLINVLIRQWYALYFKTKAEYLKKNDAPCFFHSSGKRMKRRIILNYIHELDCKLITQCVCVCVCGVCVSEGYFVLIDWFLVAHSTARFSVRNRITKKKKKERKKVRKK